MLITIAAGPQHRRDLAGDGLDVGHVGGAVSPSGVGTQRKMNSASSGGRVDAPTTNAEPPAGEPLVHQLGQSVFEDRHLALAQPRDAVGVDVGARHVVPEVGEAGRGGEPDISGAHDCNIHS